MNSNLIQLNFNLNEAKPKLICVLSNLLQLAIFNVFQEIFNFLKSYHYNFLHIKNVYMVCIRKFWLIPITCAYGHFVGFL